MRFRQSLFWDVDPKTINPQRHAHYIIERILEYGTDEEVRWMVRNYTSQKIRNTLEHSRGVLNPQTKVLWEALTRKNQ